MKADRKGYDSVRDAIVATAAALFTKTGIHGTSLNDIAAAAGLSKGTLYYYYPAKTALVMDVAERHAVFVTDTLFNWVESLTRDYDMAEALEWLIDALLKDDLEVKLHIVLSAESCLEKSELSEFMESSRRQWNVMLEVGALKVQSSSARRLRERSDSFFMALTGLMLRGGDGDRRELIRLMLG